MHNLTGVQCCYFHLSVTHTLVKKLICKFYLWTFSELLDDTEAIFEAIDLKFGIFIVQTIEMQDTYISQFFENFNF